MPRRFRGTALHVTVQTNVAAIDYPNLRMSIVQRLSSAVRGLVGGAGSIRAVLASAAGGGNIIAFQVTTPAAVETAAHGRRVHAHFGVSVLHDGATVNLGAVSTALTNYFRQKMGALAPRTYAWVTLDRELSHEISYNLKDVKTRAEARRAYRGY
jgi:hypothetical protein